MFNDYFFVFLLDFFYLANLKFFSFATFSPYFLFVGRYTIYLKLTRNSSRSASAQRDIKVIMHFYQIDLQTL